MRFTKNILWLASLLWLAGCAPQQLDKIDIGQPPQEVTFDILTTDHPNRFILRNTTPNTFLHLWDLGNGIKAEGEEVEAYYPLKGTYTITLRAFNRGGSATGSQELVVPQDDPDACQGHPLIEYLSNCDQKTWRLKPVAGALWVGPDPATTWWANSDADVAARPCAFNDEWIFFKDGTFQYDTKGDVWAEPYMGFNFECVAESDLPPNVQAWGSGTHQYQVSGDNPPKLTLIGLGAFMGLPKAANGAEVTEPQQSVTYDVVYWENDELVLEINFGPGYWRFTFTAN